MFFDCHALAGDLIQTNFPPFAQWCFQLVQLVTVAGKEEDGEMIVTASFERWNWQVHFMKQLQRENTDANIGLGNETSKQ